MCSGPTPDPVEVRGPGRAAAHPVGAPFGQVGPLARLKVRDDHQAASVGKLSRHERPGHEPGARREVLAAPQDVAVARRLQGQAGDRRLRIPDAGDVPGPGILGHPAPDGVRPVELHQRVGVDVALVEPAEHEARAPDRHQDVAQRGNARGRAQIVSALVGRQHGRQQTCLREEPQTLLGMGAMPVGRDRLARRLREGGLEDVENVAGCRQRVAESWVG